MGFAAWTLTRYGGTMDFTNSIKRNMTTAAYAQFDGRASRSEYWWFYLFTLLAGLATEVVGSTVGNLATLVFFLPGLALAVRRLHDVGRSGWWVLILFTVIGIPVFLYWTVKDSDKGKNAYGEGPARA
jgi:uncharacterized membrane protein YhaH (DUF805 family)